MAQEQLCRQQRLKCAGRGKSDIQSSIRRVSRPVPKGPAGSLFCPAENLTVPWFSDSELRLLLPLRRQGRVFVRRGKVGEVTDESRTKPDFTLDRAGMAAISGKVAC